MLVALRQWKDYWVNRRVSLRVCTDNVGALTLVTKMQPHSENLGIIAREMALDVAESTYSPDEVVHIPGISNKAADCLSRLHDPNSKTRALPAYLPSHLNTQCDARVGSWWRTLHSSA